MLNWTTFWRKPSSNLPRPKVQKKRNLRRRARLFGFVHLIHMSMLLSIILLCIVSHITLYIFDNDPLTKKVLNDEHPFVEDLQVEDATISLIKDDNAYYYPTEPTSPSQLPPSADSATKVPSIRLVYFSVAGLIPIFAHMYFAIKLIDSTDMGISPKTAREMVFRTMQFHSLLLWIEVVLFFFASMLLIFGFGGTDSETYYFSAFFVVGFGFWIMNRWYFLGTIQDFDEKLLSDFRTRQMEKRPLPFDVNNCYMHGCDPQKYDNHPFQACSDKGKF